MIHKRLASSQRLVRTEQGLSIIEVMAAATILAIIAVGAASFIPTAFRSNKNSRDMTSATQVINQVMETLENMNYSNVSPYPFATEPVYTTSNPLTVINTTTRNVSNPVTVCLQRAHATPSQCATGKTMDFPHKMTLNKTDYRVDLIVYKGKPVYLASLPEEISARFALATLPGILLEKGVLPLSEVLVPPAEAAAGTCAVSPVTSVAIGANGTFTANNSIGGSTTTWNFGPSPATVRTGDSVQHSWGQTGTYAVTVDAVKNNATTACSGSPFNVTVYNPGVDFSVTPSSLSNYINNTFSFSVDSSQCSLCTSSNTTWDFGAPNPQTAAGMTASRAYSAPGSYNVRLTVATPYGTFFGQKTLTVGQSTVNITSPASNTANVGSPVNFSATCANCPTSPYYEWDFADGQFASGSSTTHTYTQTGSPTVRVNLHDGGSTGPVVGSATTVLSIVDDKDVTLIISPTTGIAGPVSDPATTNFSYQMSSMGFSGSPNNPLNLPVTYQIWYGDTAFNLSTPDDTVVDSNPVDTNYPTPFTHKYTTCGTYTVKIRAVVGLVSAEKNYTVNVGGSAVISASATEVQAGNSITFSASSSGAGSSPSYTWTFGDDSSTSTGTSVSHTFLTSGSFPVGLSVSGGCNPSQNMQISVLPDSNTIASSQSFMKKVVVKVAPWSNAPPAANGYIGSAVFFKADND